MGTLRDALVAALTLDTFNRHADKVDMANVAQLVNNLHSLFLADGDRFVATPNFHVFEMYRPHHGARSVRIDVHAPEVAFGPGKWPKRIFRMAGSASRTGQRQLTLTLVHTHATEPAEVSILLRGGSAQRGAADRAHAHRAECPQHLRAAGDRRAQVDAHGSSRSRAALRAGACLGDTA